MYPKEVSRPPFLYPVFGDRRSEEDARQREMEGGEVDDAMEGNEDSLFNEEMYGNVASVIQSQRSERVVVLYY
jgi:hypothetical protein